MNNYKFTDEELKELENFKVDLSGPGTAWYWPDEFQKLHQSTHVDKVGGWEPDSRDYYAVWVFYGNEGRTCKTFYKESGLDNDVVREYYNWKLEGKKAEIKKRHEQIPDIKR